MKNTALLIFAFIVFQGCTSISQPTASRALVENQFVPVVASEKSVDSPLSNALSNAQPDTVLTFEEQTIVIGHQFFAATGLNCRKIVSKQTGQYIYCLDIEGYWFKVNKVISEYNESDLRETGL